MKSSEDLYVRTIWNITRHFVELVSFWDSTLVTADCLEQVWNIIKHSSNSWIPVYTTTIYYIRFAWYYIIRNCHEMISYHILLFHIHYYIIELNLIYSRKQWNHSSRVHSAQGSFLLRQFERMIYNEVIGMEEFWVRVQPRDLFSKQSSYPQDWGLFWSYSKSYHRWSLWNKGQIQLQTLHKASIHPIHPDVLGIFFSWV